MIIATSLFCSLGMNVSTTYLLKYDNCDTQVLKVNGTEIDNLEHLCQLVENCNTDSLHFDLDDNRVIVLNCEAAKIATSRILKRHRIPSSMSADLINAQSNLQLGVTSSC